MAGAQLGSVLRQIQRLYSDGSSTGLSDTQLLNRFATRRDEAAFAAILARHGPMVLAVCWRILRDPFDAEDAFQATFLVLARKAGSAWPESQLGGWLHKVAYRIAIRASADAARRRRHEQQAAEVAAVECTGAELIDDLRPALHDELARLPAKLRLPVVLCYLEGMTHAQAAVQLRCGEATLRRRLAEARERLRARLTTRGFAPSASTLCLALAREAGAAVPPVCMEATIRAVMCMAAGEAMATVVGPRVASLTQGRMAMVTTGWKTTAALVFSLAVGACLAAGIGARGGKIGTRTVQERKSSVTAPVAQPVTAPVDRKGKLSQKHAIKGLVLSPDGKPVSSATVYWLGYPRFQRNRNAMPRGWYKEKPETREKMLALGKTNAGGRFELVADFDSEDYTGRMVIVKTVGEGLSGRNFVSETVKEGSGEDERLTFKLRPTATIEGRLLTPAGAPAVGVKVLLEDFRDSENELEGDGVSSGDVRDYEPQFDFWPRSWTTDKNGRFQIEGIVPRMMVAQIRFRHPDFADDDVIVSTGLPLSDWLRAFNVKPVDAKFTHTLEPARPVTGVVTDKETGKPLSGVLVEMVSSTMRNRYGGNYPVLARTDSSGRYRAAGAAGDTYEVAAYPDPASGYLSVKKKRNKWPAGAKVLEIDLAVPKSQGIILRGRVVEAGSDRPVAGASVVYEPGPGNPHNRDEYDFWNPVLTDGEGHFALTVLPGKGRLAVDAPTPDFIHVPVTSNISSIASPHGFARLDLTTEKDKDNPPVQIALRRGVNLEARLVGPDGLPVKEMVLGLCDEIMASQLNNSSAREISAAVEGMFRLEGADPEQTYRAFFLEPKRRLGAVVELKCDPNGPVEVRMQPTATAKGVVVDHKGRPVKGTQILLWMARTKDDRKLTKNDFYDEGKLLVYNMITMEPLLPTSPAEFCYDKLIPGVRYYVSAGETHHPIPVLKPGEVLDLGKIVMKKPEGE
jgi:RNA polymerase sigma factor (sigma-70 family)